MSFSERFVKSRLSPYEAKIRLCIDNALEEFLATPYLHKLMFKRTRADIIFDLIAGRLNVAFLDDPNVRIIRKDETIKLLIENVILLRVNRANKAGLGSNICTQSVMEFVSQEAEIPDLLPEIYKVEACYREDEVGVEIESVLVTARDNNVKLWSYEMALPGSSDSSFDNSVIEFPQPPKDVAPPEISPRQDSEKSEPKDKG